MTQLVEVAALLMAVMLVHAAYPVEVWKPHAPRNSGKTPYSDG